MWLTITPTEFEVWGSATLEGKLHEAGWNGKDPITLEFTIHGRKWREQHGGPDVVCVPEYVFAELVQSCIWLMQDKHIKISVEYVEIE